MNPMNPALPKTSHTPTTDPYAADRDLPPGRPENTGDYKKALACFGTGVTVITAHHEWQDVGMTCNSFSSVSLNPAIVLWSIRKAASSLIAFTESNGFMVNVLAHDQPALAMQFATGNMTDRFMGVPAERHHSDRLRLAGTSAWFDCDLHQLVDAGDHLIVLGKVRDYGWNDTPGLAYSASQFGVFNALPAA
jgi:3-hydroxy-9,10-secoandrosta-1,3,5(10)-triene-9,17-dione monooxygenase reductase component